MRAAGRLASFGAGLVVLFGAAMQLGDAVDPIRDSSSSSHSADHADESTSHSADVVPGTTMSSGGYTLSTADTTLPAGGKTSFEFRVVNENGFAQRSFETHHGVRMHLILARRDFSGFQHLHPVMDRDGTWSAAVEPLEPGSYRAFADFVPAGAAHADDGHEHSGDTEHGASSTVLGVDVDVPGLFEPREAPAPETAVRVGPYVVRMEGKLLAGTDSRLRMSVTESGPPVPDLQTYLASPAHLVVLRAGDLGYLHVHPVTGETTGPGQVVFSAAVPTPGRYRLYLEFKHRDVVQRAEFTVDAAASGGSHGH